jgi:hypothetical protein
MLQPIPIRGAKKSQLTPSIDIIEKIDSMIRAERIYLPHAFEVGDIT